MARPVPSACLAFGWQGGGDAGAPAGSPSCRELTEQIGCFGESRARTPTTGDVLTARFPEGPVERCRGRLAAMGIGRVESALCDLNGASAPPSGRASDGSRAWRCRGPSGAALRYGDCSTSDSARGAEGRVEPAVARASGTDDTAAADARPCPSPRSGFVQTALIGPILVPGALARGCPALLLGDRHRPGSRPRTGPRPIDAAVARRGVVLPPGGSAVADRQPDGHRARPDPGTGGPRSVGASRPRVLPVDRPCGARAMRHSLTAVQPQCGKHDASIGFMQTRAAVLEIKNRARRAGPSQGERVKKWGDTSS